jgi:hypothetical protein
MQPLACVAKFVFGCTLRFGFQKCIFPRSSDEILSVQCFCKLVAFESRFCLMANWDSFFASHQEDCKLGAVLGSRHSTIDLTPHSMLDAGCQQTHVDDSNRQGYCSRYRT